MPDPILVTGGSGFLGKWCVKALLERGDEVHLTLRAGKSVEAIAADLKLDDEARGRLVGHEADLTEDAGWREAMAEVGRVLHIASPTVDDGGDQATLTTKCVAGVERVLGAAFAAGVSRVVMTSTSFTCAYPRNPTEASRRSEADWTDIDEPGLSPYVRARTVAEQRAFALAREHGMEDRLAAILPTGIIGPLLSRDMPPSVGFVAAMLKGRIPALPKVPLPLVDVRDLAELHLRAMDAPEAGGQRFVANAGELTLKELAQRLRPLADAGVKVSTRELPDWLVRLLARFDPSMRMLAPDLGVKRVYAAGKAASTLDWRPRDLDTTVTDTVASLRAFGRA